MKPEINSEAAETVQTGSDPAVDPSTACSALAMHPDLPTNAGFFWWRRVATDEWRMIQIVDWNNGGHTGTCYLSAYDVEHHDFSGRTMRAWSRFEDIGEWIPIRKPNK
jgi:hypothetical protein